MLAPFVPSSGTSVAHGVHLLNKPINFKEKENFPLGPFSLEIPEDISLAVDHKQNQSESSHNNTFQWQDIVYDSTSNAKKKKNFHQDPLGPFSLDIPEDIPPAVDPKQNQSESSHISTFQSQEVLYYSSSNAKKKKKFHEHFHDLYPSMMKHPKTHHSMFSYTFSTSDCVKCSEEIKGPNHVCNKCTNCGQFGHSFEQCTICGICLDVSNPHHPDVCTKCCLCLKDGHKFENCPDAFV